jgi:hypothetical protein
VEVRVSIVADRIEVQSSGRLPAPLTPETLGEKYALRNRVIADLRFSIRQIEQPMAATRAGHIPHCVGASACLIALKAGPDRATQGRGATS